MSFIDERSEQVDGVGPDVAKEARLSLSGARDIDLNTDIWSVHSGGGEVQLKFHLWKRKTFRWISV